MNYELQIYGPGWLPRLGSSTTSRGAEKFLIIHNYDASYELQMMDLPPLRKKRRKGRKGL
jgi:hypothetical protein